MCPTTANQETGDGGEPGSTTAAGALASSLAGKMEPQPSAASLDDLASAAASAYSAETRR